MGWERALITDSGGFQVFSLAHGGVADEVKGSGRPGGEHGSVVSIGEEGVRFRSYRDGAELFISPEVSMQVQAALGSDIALVFDECTPYHADRDYTARSMERTHRWLERCLEWHAERGARRGRPSSAIVQGGVHEDLRRESAAGGLGGRRRRDRDRRHPRPRQGGDGRGAGDDRAAAAGEAPKHLLGIGEVDDLLAGIALGLDVFDCAVPTRLARHGGALVPDPESRFRLDLRKSGWEGDRRPARRGLPLPGLPQPRPRLPQLPLARRGADRRPPPLPPQPHLHAGAARRMRRQLRRPRQSLAPWEFERPYRRLLVDPLGDRRDRP